MPMKCEKCGAIIEDNAVICPRCKCSPIDETVEQIKKEMRAKQKKRKLITAVIFAASLAVIAAVGIIIGVVSKNAADLKDQKEELHHFAVESKRAAIDHLTDQGMKITEDAIIGLSDKEKAILFAEPAAPFDRVVLLDDDEEVFNLEGSDDRLASSKDDCRYVIAYVGCRTTVEENYYYKYGGGYTDSTVDRVTMTTVVFVIDTDRQEVVHAYFVGSNKPGDSTKTATGEVLATEAKEYIAGLLR